MLFYISINAVCVAVTSSSSFKSLNLPIPLSLSSFLSSRECHSLSYLLLLYLLPIHTPMLPPEYRAKNHDHEIDPGNHSP